MFQINSTTLLNFIESVIFLGYLVCEFALMRYNVVRRTSQVSYPKSKERELHGQGWCFGLNRLKVLEFHTQFALRIVIYLDVAKIMVFHTFGINK